MRAGRWWVWIAGLALAGAAQAADVAVPGVLEPWRAWALYGQEQALCAQRDGEASSPQCRWPGTLVLEADARGLRFTQSWTLQAPGRVPLPGDARLRPVAVEVEGRAMAVVPDAEDRPWIVLDAGVHRVQGRVDWSRRPATLPLPDEIALISARVDGATLLRPQRNEDGDLVLGAVDAEEGDALQVETYRLLADGVPQMLATRVYLSVSGKPREQTFSALLPEGFVPVALDSEVPARLESDGRLRLQLRSGSFALTLLARALHPRESFVLPEGGDWPTQEIWQYRADPQFRVAQLTGLSGIDPSQVSVPDWIEDIYGSIPDEASAMFRESDGLPAFLFERGGEARLEIALRGLPAQRPPRLHLQRSLWLDFDGQAWSSSDHISGELGGAARIDLRAPWLMQRASAKRGLLITSGVESGLSGVELRDADVDVTIDARVPRAGLVLASGWTHGFDQASAVLNLPPAYRLIAATGADYAGGSWWDAWNLLDLFLLSVIALLAWRLGGVILLLLAAGYAVLGWHEPDAPRASVLVLLALALLAKHVVTGRLGSVARGLRWLALVAVGLWTLGFAATELRLALHPQLEQSGQHGVEFAQRAGSNVIVEMAFNEAPPAPLPQQAPRMAKSLDGAQEDQVLDQIEVTGSRIKTVDLFSYPADAIVQSGSARPSWSWQRHTLGWNGPLLPDDELGLVISPPWLTRLWRVAAVALLFGLLWQVARRRPTPASARPAALASTAAVPTIAALTLSLLASGFAPPLQAQTMADSELIESLRQRLVARDEPCRPTCAALGAAAVVAHPERLLLALDAQAQAEVVWPLPRPDASLVLVAARVDGAAAAVLRDGDGDWLRLQRGVRRVELEYAPEGERWRLAFPLPPASMQLQAPGFEAIGLDEGRLVGDTLELVPPRRAATADAGDAGGNATDDLSEAIPPFVRVERSVWLDQFWEVQVTVRRVAPLRSGINLRVALLPGEQPFQDAPTVRDGAAVVSLPAGVQEIGWRSRLSPVPRLTLQAGDGRSYSEEWLITTSPLLHIETTGLPPSGREHEDGAVRRFLPLPGETLEVDVTRPQALEGARFAIENVALQVTPGQRARDSQLTFELRATQAGQHRILLPEAAELIEFSIDGEAQPRVIERGELRLPLRPTTQHVALRWREAVDAGLSMRSPDVALGASASNLSLALSPPDDRWVLFTRGPQVGPAVLLWGELLVMALAAFVLARIGNTPLRFQHWLLLGLGFSTLSWMAAAVVVAWLLLLGWRARRTDLVPRRVFPWLQVGLVALSGAALLALVIAVPFGLLGRPDMHIVGNDSSLHALRWFADRAEDGVLPSVQVISVPLWTYKLAILAWAMWLANALIGWLRWAWACLGSGGWWSPIWRRKVTAAPAAVTERSAAVPSASGSAPDSGD